MVSVTKATLGRNAVYFIVEVLRNNLTDSHSTPRDGKEWILKSQPKDPVSTSNLPRIVLDVSDIGYRSIAFSGQKYISDTITIEANIYTGGSNVSAGALTDRDTYADSIRTVLFDPSSADTNGTTLTQNHLVLRNVRESVTDFYGEHPSIIRSKRMLLDFKYYGGET